MNLMIPEGLPQQNRLKPLLMDTNVMWTYIKATQDDY